jgi:hypothetical protein
VRAEDAGGRADPLGGHAADPGGPFGRAVAHALAQRLVAHGVRRHEGVVDVPAGDELVQYRAEQRDVRARAERQVHIGLPCRRRRTRVDHDELRRVGSREAVEHPRPQRDLRLGKVVADEEDDLALIDVRVGAGCPSAPSVSFSAAAAVAVHSRVLPSRWFVPMPAFAMTASV